MRTNIDIDDALMARAMKATGKKTKKETVQYALETVVRLNKQSRIRDLRGTFQFTVDLDSLRDDGK